MTPADSLRRGGLLRRSRLRLAGYRWLEVLVIDEVRLASGGGFHVVRSHRQWQWVPPARGRRAPAPPHRCAGPVVLAAPLRDGSPPVV